MTRLQELINLRNYHRELYYNGRADPSDFGLADDEPEISDAEYDLMEKEIKGLSDAQKADVKVLSEVGPKDGEVRHASRMGSLAKIHDLEAFKVWYRKYARKSASVWALPKYDGLSLSERYENNRAFVAATRGDGETGADVTKAAVESGIMPSRIPESGVVEFRGEAVMLKSVFNRLNAAGAGFKNPRSAASGSLKRSSGGERGLSFFCYSVLGKEFKTFSEMRDFISSCGFNPGTGERIDIGNGDFSGIEKFIVKASEGRAGLDYQIDGIVFVLEDLEDHDTAGWSSDGHHPNSRIAYKFPPSVCQTEITGYRLQVGKTGRIIPVADIKPVEIDGSTVESPTLHNVANMINNGLFPGAVVHVCKANDIIPYIDPAKIVKKVFKTADQFMAENGDCPCCGEKTEFDGVNLWCRNELCAARLSSRVLHFLKTVDCLNVGERAVDKLIESGYVKTLWDIVKPSSVREVAKAIKSSSLDSREAEIIHSALSSVRNIPLAVFIESLGIPGCSKGTAKRLTAVFKDVKSLVESVTKENLLEIPDVGPVTADSIMSFIRRNGSDILVMADRIGVLSCKKSEGVLSGKSFLFTGTLSKKRKVFEDFVCGLGGTIAGSVNKDLDYLCVGETAGSKLDKARRLGIKTITETELEDMAGTKV